MSTGIAEGQSQDNRSIANPMYLQTGDPGLSGGGTYTGSNTQPTLEQYENIFGPAARDIKLDQQRHKRHQRWHLPDALKGSNQYLTDRIDGLITDATNSPFTRNILPYVYLENPDQKIKWNVYSFDEGIASRVPYESAARVLPQTKRSFAGYTVRQGLAIAMEHNFMVSAAGRENFKNQLTQLVGSIQMTNDLDVHVALLSAPSYQKHMNEKYYDTTKTTAQSCRQFVDLFGIMQKIPNALDILIEDAKNHLKTWGSAPPTFLLCNGALTAQMTMLPEKTNYLTNGPDGAARLAQGPDLPSYRGLSIIHSRKFSMDAGTAPRDLLRRRVRVAEYYRIPWSPQNKNRMYEFYDQSRDTMFRLSWNELCKMAEISPGMFGTNDEDSDLPYHEETQYWRHVGGRQDPQPWNYAKGVQATPPTFLRITHNRNQRDESTDEYEDTTGAIQALFTSLGVSPDVFYKQSSLLWPRTVEPVLSNNAERERKKMTIEFLSDKECVKDMVGKHVTNHMLAALMRQTARNKLEHHKYSEINPIVNDHIVKSVFNEGDPVLLANFDALAKSELYTAAQSPERHAHYGHNAELYTCFHFAHAFVKEYSQHKTLYENFVNHMRSKPFTIYSCERHIVVAALRAVMREKNVQWLMANDAVVQNPYEDNAFINIENNQVQWGDYVDPRATIRTLWNSIPTENLPLEARERIADQNNPQYQNDPLADNYEFELLHKYRLILLEWRRQYWTSLFRRIPNLENAALRDGGGPTSVDASYHHNAHIDQMPKMKYALMTLVVGKELLSYVRLENFNIWELGNQLTAAKIEQFNSNTMTTYLAYNLYNRSKHNQGIYAPNLHISRCTPLQQEHARLSASSMVVKTWLLQQVAGMMPLTKEMCKMLTSSPVRNYEGDGNMAAPAVLYNEYAKFFHGEDGKITRNNNDQVENEQQQQIKHYDTFLMHWYMSEFHPLSHVRVMAKKMLGMDSDRHGVSQLLDCFATCLRNNTTYHKNMEMAFQHMQPVDFTRNEILVCNATATKKCVYVTPFCKSEKDKVFHEIDWENMPVPHKALDMSLAQNRYNEHDQFEGWQRNGPNKDSFYDAHLKKEINMSNIHEFQHTEKYNNWMRFLPGFCNHVSTLNYHVQIDPEQNTPERMAQNIYHVDETYAFQEAAESMAQDCESEDPVIQDNLLRHIVLVLANRFWKPTTRAMNNGQGLAISKNENGDEYYFSGCHLMHGPDVPQVDENEAVGGVPQDLLILRPNIEHEMLGIIMGRGGTQELGATFWGQTELSCYDDAQHGIWGMSYKYHERAMVTNERNLIRVYDVAFDGYNGGMDQRHVDWGNSESLNSFREATYDRTRPYNGPSMLVMALPHDRERSHRAWPNPIIFTQDVLGNYSLSPEKEQPPSDVKQHMIFDCAKNDHYCSLSQAAKFKNYMQALGMEHWTTVDQANRPAGDCCIGNETSSNMFAFEGTMKVLDKNSGAMIDCTQGSGHLGPSYVGVASIREGRGILSANMQPSLHRLV